MARQMSGKRVYKLSNDIVIEGIQCMNGRMVVVEHRTKHD